MSNLHVGDRVLVLDNHPDTAYRGKVGAVRDIIISLYPVIVMLDGSREIDRFYAKELEKIDA